MNDTQMNDEDELYFRKDVMSDDYDSHVCQMTPSKLSFGSWKDHEFDNNIWLKYKWKNWEQNGTPIFYQPVDDSTVMALTSAKDMVESIVTLTNRLKDWLWVWTISTHLNQLRKWRRRQVISLVHHSTGWEEISEDIDELAIDCDYIHNLIIQSHSSHWRLCQCLKSESPSVSDNPNLQWRTLTQLCKSPTWSSSRLILIVWWISFTCLVWVGLFALRWLNHTSMSTLWTYRLHQSRYYQGNWTFKPDTPDVRRTWETQKKELSNSMVTQWNEIHL